LELQKNLGEDIVDGKAVKVYYGEAFKKADVLRVVNEEFNQQLKKEGKELEKMSYQELIDKVQSYVRLNSKKVKTEIGNINMNIEDYEKEELKEEDQFKELEEDWNKEDENWIGYMGYKGFGKERKRWWKRI